MNAIGLLSLILFAALMLVAGKQGLKIFLGLVINFAVIFILIILLNWQFNPYVVTAILSVTILAVSIYLSSDNSQVMNTAFKASLVITAGLMLVAYLAQLSGQLQGFATENSDELEGLSLAVGLNFGHLAVVVMVLSALGAIAEASMAITADLHEVIERTPTIQVTNLEHHARIIGRQILGTAINTLFFGMLGSTLPLLIWFLRLRYSLSMFFNAKLLVMELITMLLGMLGILLSIWLASHLVVNDFKKGRIDLDAGDL
ncbi:YibE/F family protein [Leuconostocaceae bacterium ESL0723]|nr:YibE/F family protein [Leuconostocaceae bacterium ESL0723]